MRANGEDVIKVTLACTIAQEKKSYADNEPHFLATKYIRALDSQIELHFILGERSDVVCVVADFCALSSYSGSRMNLTDHVRRPRYCHESIMALREFASVQQVGRAGHFVRAHAAGSSVTEMMLMPPF